MRVPRRSTKTRRCAFRSSGPSPACLPAEAPTRPWRAPPAPRLLSCVSPISPSAKSQPRSRLPFSLGPRTHQTKAPEIHQAASLSGFSLTVPFCMFLYQLHSPLPASGLSPRASPPQRLPPEAPDSAGIFVRTPGAFIHLANIFECLLGTWHCSRCLGYIVSTGGRLLPSEASFGR